MKVLREWARWREWAFSALPTRVAVESGRGGSWPGVSASPLPRRSVAVRSRGAAEPGKRRAGSGWAGVRGAAAGCYFRATSCCGWLCNADPLAVPTRGARLGGLGGRGGGLAPLAVRSLPCPRSASGFSRGRGGPRRGRPLLALPPSRPCQGVSLRIREPTPLDRLARGPIALPVCKMSPLDCGAVVLDNNSGAP